MHSPAFEHRWRFGSLEWVGHGASGGRRWEMTLDIQTWVRECLNRRWLDDEADGKLARD